MNTRWPKMLNETMVFHRMENFTFLSLKRCKNAKKFIGAMKE